MTLPNQIDQGLTCPACGVQMLSWGEGEYLRCNGAECDLRGLHLYRAIAAIHAMIAAARKPTVPRLELHGGKWTLTLPGDGIPLSQAADLIESAGKAIREVRT